nr:unnamed protein product [Spirometra erinaceieuropaei]
MSVSGIFSLNILSAFLSVSSYRQFKPSPLYGSAGPVSPLRTQPTNRSTNAIAASTTAPAPTYMSTTSAPTLSNAASYPRVAIPSANTTVTILASDTTTRLCILADWWTEIRSVTAPF